MFKSLLFDCEPIEQPAAVDLLEQKTWSAFQVRVGDRCLSRLWDASLPGERTTLCLPVIPIAEWIVRNWWFLLHETPRSENIAAVGRSQLSWIRRHCLRAADSSLLLPALFLFHDGHDLRAEWQADQSDSLPHLRGEFVDSGSESLNATLTRDACARLINDVLHRVSGICDERVNELAAAWEAIQAADPEEESFCVLAARLGIDPYDPAEIPKPVATFLEQCLDDARRPLLWDLTEVAESGTVCEQWQWIRQTCDQLQIGPSVGNSPIPISPGVMTPASSGYQLARAVRSQLRIASDALLGSVTDMASEVTSRVFRCADVNHVPGTGIKAVIGATPAGDLVAAGPAIARPDNQRFLLARSLYHALVTVHASPRLVSDAHSWEQKASRAFAAELLAPQQALTDLIGSQKVAWATVEELAQHFTVSTQVIQRQLENAGIPVTWD